jgi:hypothetical protein
VSLLEVDDLSFTFRFGVDISGLFSKSDLEKVVDRVKREITTEMTEKMDKLESRIFELEIKNDDLYQKNENRSFPL